MANTLGLFDKQLVKVAWFDPTLQPGGWFSTDIVTTEGEAPTGVEATAALNEAADTGAAQVSVATHVTGVLVETGDSATAQASIAINAATATTEAPDTLSAQSGVSVGATSSLTESADTVFSNGSVNVSAITGLSESSDVLVAIAGVVVSADATSNETGDALAAQAALLVQSVAVLSESSDTLAAIATAQSASALVSATATLNESSDTLAAQATAYVAGAVAADITLSESPDAISSTASIGDAETGAWTAWGDSWGDAWGFSWGVFEQPYTKLKLGQQIFVFTELSKHYTLRVSSQIIAFAEKHEVSVLTAMASRMTVAQRPKREALNQQPANTSPKARKQKRRVTVSSTEARLDLFTATDGLYVTFCTAPRVVTVFAKDENLVVKHNKISEMF